MKRFISLKWLLLSLMIPIGATASAQYSFSLTMHGDGSPLCQQVAAQVQSQVISKIGSLSGFPTRAACESARSYAMSVKSSVPGCKIYYTASPCIGTDITSIGSNVIPGAPPVGNPALELGAQIEDYTYMRDLQNPIAAVDYILGKGNRDYFNELNSLLSDEISAGDKDYQSFKVKKLIEDPVNGAAASAETLWKIDYRKLSDAQLSQFFKDEYRRLTGMDIDVLLNKMDLTIEEQAIVDNYNLFVDKVIDSLESRLEKQIRDEEGKPLEYALYALDVYGDDDLSEYNLPKPLADVSSLPEADRHGIQGILDLLNEYNDNNWGFASNLYYDASQDKYVLSFRGTEPGPRDFGSDLMFALFGMSGQHGRSSSLADALKNSGIPMDKFVITGHSLGGGLAVLAGLKTGCKTYAYNPQHITNKAVGMYNLDVSEAAQSNIEVFTAVGESLVSPLEGVANDLQNFVIPDGLPKFKDDRYLVLGNQHAVVTEEGLVKHSQVAMVNGLTADLNGNVNGMKSSMGRLRASDSFLHRNPSSLFRMTDADRERFAPAGVPITVISKK